MQFLTSGHSDAQVEIAEITWDDQLSILSLPRSFTPDLNLISFTNPFRHSLSGSFWTAFTDLEPWHWHMFVLVSVLYHLPCFLATCARLNWSHSAFESTLTLWRHMGTAMNHPVPDRVKPSFVIFDIHILWRSGLSARVSWCQKLQMTA